MLFLLQKNNILIIKMKDIHYILFTILIIIIYSIITECSKKNLSILNKKIIKDIVESFTHYTGIQPSQEGQWGYQITGITEGIYGGRSSQDTISIIGKHNKNDYITEDEKSSYSPYINSITGKKSNCGNILYSNCQWTDNSGNSIPINDSTSSGRDWRKRITSIDYNDNSCRDKIGDMVKCKSDELNPNQSKCQNTTYSECEWTDNRGETIDPDDVSSTGRGWRKEIISINYNDGKCALGNVGDMIVCKNGELGWKEPESCNNTPLKDCGRCDTRTGIPYKNFPSITRYEAKNGNYYESLYGGTPCNHNQQMDSRDITSCVTELHNKYSKISGKWHTLTQKSQEFTLKKGAMSARTPQWHKHSRNMSIKFFFDFSRLNYNNDQISCVKKYVNITSLSLAFNYEIDGKSDGQLHTNFNIENEKINLTNVTLNETAPYNFEIEMEVSDIDRTLGQYLYTHLNTADEYNRWKEYAGIDSGIIFDRWKTYKKNGRHHIKMGEPGGLLKSEYMQTGFDDWPDGRRWGRDSFSGKNRGRIQHFGKGMVSNFNNKASSFRIPNPKINVRIWDNYNKGGWMGYCDLKGNTSRGGIKKIEDHCPKKIGKIKISWNDKASSIETIYIGDSFMKWLDSRNPSEKKSYSKIKIILKYTDSLDDAGNPNKIKLEGIQGIQFHT